MSAQPQPSSPSGPRRPSSGNSSVMWRVRLLFVALCLALLSVEAWKAWKDYTERLREAQTNVVNMAQALAQQGNDTLQAADIIVASVIEMVENEGITPHNRQRLRTLLRARVADVPQLSGLYIIDAGGHVLVDSQDQPFTDNVSARAYFQHHLHDPSRSAFIGPLIRRNDGSWRLTVSRRINHADGSFGGVMVAGIDITYFRRFYDSFDIGRDGLIVLGLNSGALLVRRPFQEQSIGYDMNQVAVFRDYVARNEAGTFTTNPSPDGKQRLNAYRHFAQYPLFISIALAKNEVLAGWQADTWHHAIALLLLIVLLALLGNWLLLQIRRRVQTEHKLRVARDDLDQLNRHLQNLALEDGLTGMSNRRHFDSALNQEFLRALRHGDTLALIMIDIDWFKQYNDLYGHRAGDECLRRVAASVRMAPQRAGDVAARYGGEEMAVLLPQTSLDAATTIAERIRRSIVTLDLPHAASPLTIVTVSAGVAIMQPTLQSEEPEQLVEAADRALYIAKAKGRNCVARQDDVKFDIP